MQSFTDGTTPLSETFGYNNRNDVTQVNRYSDTTQVTKIGITAYGYDGAGLVTSITHESGAGVTTPPLDSFTYTYDNADNVKTETSTLGPPKTYTYDATNQLTGDGTTTYNWDANGNNTAFTLPANNNNEITSDGTWTYTYDADGNETSKTIPATGENWTYTYNVDNRLIEADHKPTTLGAVDIRDQFSYDVLGNRISKTTGVGAPTTTKFAYDANGNAWVDYTGTSTIVARHIFGMSTDDLIANITAGSTTWYLRDLLGSTRDLTNATGVMTDHLDYNSFGKLTHESNPGTADRYQWTGREVDVELGLQYNRARYYDANTQRWISQDQMGFDAGDSNLYRYANNGPTGATDPSGMDIILLFDPNAKAGGVLWVGHPAVLIGSDETGWRYFSFHAGKLTTRKDNLQQFSFKTLDAAKRERELRDYVDYIRFKSTKAQDENAIKEAESWDMKLYDLPGQNCCHFGRAVANAADVELPRYQQARGAASWPTWWWSDVMKDAKTNKAVVETGKWEHIFHNAEALRELRGKIATHYNGQDWRDRALSSVFGSGTRAVCKVTLIGECHDLVEHALNEKRDLTIGERAVYNKTRDSLKRYSDYLYDIFELPPAR